MNTHAKVLLICFTVSALIASCASNDDDIDATGTAEIAEVQQLLADARSNIIGSWSYTYPETQCEEQYEFTSEGLFSQTSLDEILAGNYFIEPFATNMTQIRFQATEDNLGTDCLGSNVDATTDNDYVFVVSFPSSNQMDWALISDPETVSISLQRL